MVQQQVVSSSSSSSSSSAHIFIKSRLKNPLQNFAEGEVGESRDNVAERLDWARRLEQVERLKAEERMKNPVENFPQGEAGITPRMREKLPSGNISLGSKGSPPRMREQTPYGKFSGGRSGDHPAHAGTDIRENFRGSELVPFPE